MKFARQNGNRAGYEINEDGSHGDDLEEMIYKTPIAERDERMSLLEKEKKELQDNLQVLREELKKTIRGGTERQGSEGEQRTSVRF